MSEDIQTLVDKWGEADVEKAMWLSRHIKEHGLDGIGFMERGRNHIRSDGDFTARKKIKAQMKGRY